ncbi:uncharacterized protein CFAP97D2 [Myripristis murdjan]|uniref:Si:ch211-284k5.2 n=1 Tax=Myripristis murdjan TaxID=586833 RepID=A0A667YFX3_9TELE|nr:uncharacterized protein CFAP97D2-like [Myripristis murdjan]
MHRSYQPMKPVTNRYLQRRWDQSSYEDHRRKVNFAQPIVDTRGMKTPAHVQLKLKKLQLQDERLSIIDRDNRFLASKLAEIARSPGLVDHRNPYQQRSLNSDKRREEFLLVSRQNQAIFQRITARQSDYRHQLWLDDWERTERRRNDIARFPRGLPRKQKSERKVKFASAESNEQPETSSSTDSTDRET